MGGLPHKLMQVMLERDSAKKLSGFVELDDAYLGGERSGGKVGRGAAGKTPFVAAVETNNEGHPMRIKLSVVKGFRTHEIARWSRSCLTAGSTVISDGLACFNAVTEASVAMTELFVVVAAHRLKKLSSTGLTPYWVISRALCAAPIMQFDPNMRSVTCQNSIIALIAALI